MLSRRSILQLPALGLLALPGRASSVSKSYALIVGIDQYLPTSPNAKSSPRNFQPLDGAVNDALLMEQILKGRFGFQPENILLLRNEGATRRAILDGFQRHLIDNASAGDTCLFYFAGHGSFVKNLASQEADQLDETLVPYDATQGVGDIRDKEMARLYRAAAQKGIGLTVVLDSCHSGGMARGLWAGGKTRWAEPDQKTIELRDDRDPATGEKLPDPASLGVLFLFAARDDQAAAEALISQPASNGSVRSVAHGAFTASLARVLQTPVAGQSLEQICERVQAVLASEGKTQIPVCSGKDRAGRGLLGQAAGLGATNAIAVKSIDRDGSIHLLGGSALGLASGCTLKRIGDRPMQIRLTRVDLATADAERLSPGSKDDIQEGDLFKLDSWSAVQSRGLKVHFCKSGPSVASLCRVQQLLDTASRENKCELVDEVIPGRPPTHVLRWDKDSYVLDTVTAAGQSRRVGPAPTVSVLCDALSGAKAPRLWALLPADPNVASEIDLGAGSTNPAIEVTGQPSDAHYLLAGRVRSGVPEYTWILKNAFNLAADNQRLPVRTDWKRSGKDLTSLASSLGRIYGWLNLESPPGDDAFPYRLTFEEAASGRPSGADPLKIGQKYKIVFSADPAALRVAANRGDVARRYVYVFAIDSEGKGVCLFPEPANGNDGNFIPRGPIPESRILATRYPYDLVISPPAGTDNYFLVTSQEQLDPSIFQWTGVKTEASARRGSGGALEMLFNSVAEGRGVVASAHPVPVNWSIQSMPVQSVL